MDLAPGMRRKAAELLQSSTPRNIIASILIAALLGATQWPLASHDRIVLWLAAMTTVAVSKGLLCLWYRHRPRAQRALYTWVRLYAINVFLSGLGWGAAGPLLFSSNSVSELLLPMLVVSAIVAFEAASLVPIWYLVFLLVAPCVVAWVVHLGQLPATTGELSATLLIACGVLLGMLSGRAHKKSQRNIALRAQRAKRKRRLRENEERYRQIFDHAPLGVLHYDQHGVVVACNDNVVAALGTTRQQLLGFNMLEDLPNDSLRAAIRESLQGNAGYFEDLLQATLSNPAIPVRAFFQGVRSPEGGLVGGVAIMEDFSERKRVQDLIEHQALYDPLTDLPNRRLLGERLGQALQRCRRHGRFGALLYLDLDHFKNINDSLGHPTGDALLKNVAERLGRGHRSEDTAARLGGDEFVVLLPEAGESEPVAREAATQVASKIHQCLSQPYLIAGNEFHVTPSIGVAVFPRGTESVDDILRRADTAMYRAKQDGRNAICFHLRKMDAELETRLSLENDLRFAIEHQQLSFHLQPQVNDQGQLLGAEALLRWHHPTRGSIPPNVFVPIAEETGLIFQIGEWLLANACQEIQAWEALSDSGNTRHIAVNISVNQLRNAAFADQVCATLARFNIPPHCLTLELPESLFMENLSDAVRNVQQLKSRGVRIAIEDFGIGYSSLTYLRQLHLDVLKIDRSFVRELGSNPSHAAIVETILAMARHLDLRVIAEGVETRAELDFLRHHGCTAFQGHFFSPALPLYQFRPLLHTGRWPVPTNSKALAQVRAAL